MSDSTPARLSFDDMPARVDCRQAETGKCVAERSKRIAEQQESALVRLIGLIRG